MIDALTPNSAAQDEASRLAAPTEAPRLAASNAASLFGSRLDQARTAGQGDQAQLKELTEMLVSSAFIMPMFEKLRNDPLAANLFHGGRGEKVFQQQLDQVLSDRIAGSTKMGLAEAIYNQLSRGEQTGQAIDTHG